jgi:hypothetical protein
MALVAALHARQAESYGPGAVERVGLGVLTVLPTIVGMALILVGNLAPLDPVAQNLMVVGFMVATVGFFALAMVTLVVRVWPWWVAALLLAWKTPRGGAPGAVARDVLGTCGLRRLAGRERTIPTGTLRSGYRPTSSQVSRPARLGSLFSRPAHLRFAPLHRTLVTR